MSNPENNKLQIFTFRTRANKAKANEQNRDAAYAHDPEPSDGEDEGMEPDDRNAELELVNLRKQGHKK